MEDETPRPGSVDPAETLRMKPGSWEITTVTTMPMLPSPQTTTSTECVRDEVFDPRTLMQDSEGCRVTQHSVKGNTMTWSMECTSAEARMGGRGEVTIDDTLAHGSMQMEMGQGGPVMEMKSSWSAKYLGACE